MANYRVVHLVILKSNFGSFLFVASAAIALVGRTQRVVVLKTWGAVPDTSSSLSAFRLLPASQIGRFYPWWILLAIGGHCAYCSLLLVLREVFV